MREPDGSLRQLGDDENVPDGALARGLFLVPDDQPVAPAAPTGSAAWPDGWVELGATEDGIQDSLFLNTATGTVTVEHHERWTL